MCSETSGVGRVSLGTLGGGSLTATSGTWGFVPAATLPLGLGPFPFGAGLADGLADDGGGPLGGLEPYADGFGSMVGGADLSGGGVVPVLLLEDSFGRTGGVLVGGEGVLPG